MSSGAPIMRGAAATVGLGCAALAGLALGGCGTGAAPSPSPAATVFDITQQPVYRCTEKLSSEIFTTVDNSMDLTVLSDEYGADSPLFTPAVQIASQTGAYRFQNGLQAAVKAVQATVAEMCGQALYRNEVLHLHRGDAEYADPSGRPATFPSFSGTAPTSPSGSPTGDSGGLSTDDVVNVTGAQVGAAHLGDAFASAVTKLDTQFRLTHDGPERLSACGGQALGVAWPNGIRIFQDVDGNVAAFDLSRDVSTPAVINLNSLALTWGATSDAITRQFTGAAIDPLTGHVIVALGEGTLELVFSNGQLSQITSGDVCYLSASSVSTDAPTADTTNIIGD